MSASELLAETGSVPARFAPGQLLDGKFQIERVLGRGGMGVVLKARHLQLGRVVAIKVMLPSRSRRDHERRERFLREARTSMRLRSEHVARVIDTGTVDGDTPYLVMEYLDGQDLDELRRARGRLTVAQAVDVVLQAGEAIAEAHAHGIIHRDLKPANLFATRRADGSTCVKVLDFGLAKDVTDPPIVPLTDPSTTVGSPRYMAPEQLRGTGELDARADLWAVGVILYELVTGQPPFAGQALVDLTFNIFSEPPAPLAVAVPPGFEAVLWRCLEKDAIARHADIAELAAALAPYGPPDAGALAARIARIGANARVAAASAGSAEARHGAGAAVMIAPALITPAPSGGAATARSRPRLRRAAQLAGVALVAAAVATAVLLQRGPDRASTAGGLHAVPGLDSGRAGLPAVGPDDTAPPSAPSAIAPSPSSPVVAAPPRPPAPPRARRRPPRAPEPPPAPAPITAEPAADVDAAIDLSGSRF